MSRILKLTVCLIFAMLGITGLTGCDEDPDLYQPIVPENPGSLTGGEEPGIDKDGPIDGNDNAGKDEDDPKDEEDIIIHRILPLDLPMPELKAPSFYVFESDLSITDAVNQREWRYNILLPPSYNESTNTYPVLFLLHGLDANRNNWTSSLNLNGIINYHFFNSSMPEIIVVMPDAENTYYLNNHQGTVKYEDYFMTVLLPEIRKNYRVNNRIPFMIGGFSMGGYGAAYYALKYPSIFGFCYTMSAPLDGKGRSTTVNSLFGYFNTLSLEEWPYFVMDIGNEDFFVKSNKSADSILDKAGRPHEFILRNGEHNSQFWEEGLFIMMSRITDYIIGSTLIY